MDGLIGKLIQMELQNEKQENKKWRMKEKFHKQTLIIFQNI